MKQNNSNMALVFILRFLQQKNLRTRRLMALLVIALATIFTHCAYSRSYDWRSEGSWTGKITIAMDNSHVSEQTNFPFRNTKTLPGEVLSVRNVNGNSLLTINIYSTSDSIFNDESNGVRPIDDISLNKELDSVQITLLAPLVIGAKIKKSIEKERGSAFSCFTDNPREFHFVFSNDFKELLAICFDCHSVRHENCQAVGDLWVGNFRIPFKPPSPSPRTVEELSKGETLGDLLQKSPKVRSAKDKEWFQPRLPKSKFIHFDLGGEHFRIPANTLNSLWLNKPDSGNSVFLENAYMPAFFFWISPEGYTMYVTRVQSSSGADAPVITTLTASVSVSEHFGEREKWSAAVYTGEFAFSPVEVRLQMTKTRIKGTYRYTQTGDGAIYDLKGYFDTDGAMILETSLNGAHTNDLILRYISDPSHIVWRGIMTDVGNANEIKVSFRRKK